MKAFDLFDTRRILDDMLQEYEAKRRDRPFRFGFGFGLNIRQPMDYGAIMCDSMLRGPKVVISTSPVMERKVWKRVRGGYMNHWLIRKEVTEYLTYHDRQHDILYVHPVVAQQMGYKHGDRT